MNQPAAPMIAPKRNTETMNIVWTRYPSVGYIGATGALGVGADLARDREAILRDLESISEQQAAPAEDAAGFARRIGRF